MTDNPLGFKSGYFFREESVTSAYPGIDTNHAGNTQGNIKLGGSTSSAEEWGLSPSKNYVITITNSTSPGANINVNYNLYWYEEGSGY